MPGFSPGIFFWWRRIAVCHAPPDRSEFVIKDYRRRHTARAQIGKDSCARRETDATP